mgnify:CR=1 FL=1
MATTQDNAITSRRRFAQSLLAQGMQATPVQHWSQALARAVQGGMGGYLNYQADEQERANDKADAMVLASAPGLEGPSESPLPPPTAGPRSPSFSPVTTLPQEPPSQATGSMYAGLSGWAPGEKPIEQPLREQPLDGMAPRTQGLAALGTAMGGQPPMTGMNPAGATPVQTQAITPPQQLAHAVSPPAPRSPVAIPKDVAAYILKLNERKETRPQAQALYQQYSAPTKPTDEMREYELYRQQGGKESFYDYKSGLKKAGAVNVQTNVGGGTDKQIFDTMDESAKAARTTAAGLTGLREARSALQAGAITGAGANQILGLQKVGALLGVSNSDKIVNTETFRAAIAPQVAAMLKSTVGTAQISNTDREFAEKAAGGNITLDGGSIARLLDIMERAGSAQLSGHMKRLEKVYPDAEKFARERALFGVDVPAAVPSPTGKPVPTETRIISGKTYFKQDGQWFEGQP